jgi:hypothetical protein
MRSIPVRARVLGTTLVLGLSVLSGGCGTVKRTGTTRTATEQLLLTNAWDEAVRKIDFRDLAGVPVFLDVQNVTAVDQGWVVSSLRQAMLQQGVLLRPKAEQAQWVVEARVGAYGTDEYDWLLGVPQFSVPPTITGVPAGPVPEIPLIKKTDQMGVAKLALFAYDKGSGRLMWSSGTVGASSSAKDVYVGGFGPVQSGTIRANKSKNIGINIPMISDPGLTVGPSPSRSTPGMSMPAAASDLGTFAP